MSTQFVPWNSIRESLVDYGQRRMRYPEGLASPCVTCRTALDFFRYSLGFPGVEIGFGDDGWSLIVESTCRHLLGNRCGLFGQPERPLPCQFYDAWQCSYKPRLGQARPAGYIRLGLEHFDWLAECYRFDGDGRVVQSPGLEDIRGHVEARWRESRRL
jgi:hypothetical protein